MDFALGNKSGDPESNQGPSDSCTFYSQMLCQLSYRRLVFHKEPLDVQLLGWRPDATPLTSPCRAQGQQPARRKLQGTPKGQGAATKRKSGKLVQSCRLALASDLGCVWRRKPSFFCSCGRLPLGAALNPKAGPDATQKPRGLRTDFRFNFAYLGFVRLGDDPAARSHRVEHFTARWPALLATPPASHPNLHGLRAPPQWQAVRATNRKS